MLSEANEHFVSLLRWVSSTWKQCQFTFSLSRRGVLFVYVLIYVDRLPFYACQLIIISSYVLAWFAAKYEKFSLKTMMLFSQIIHALNFDLNWMGCKYFVEFVLLEWFKTTSVFRSVFSLRNFQFWPQINYYSSCSMYKNGWNKLKSNHNTFSRFASSNTLKPLTCVVRDETTVVSGPQNLCNESIQMNSVVKIK